MAGARLSVIRKTVNAKVRFLSQNIIRMSFLCKRTFLVLLLALCRDSHMRPPRGDRIPCKLGNIISPAFNKAIVSNLFRNTRIRYTDHLKSYVKV